MRRPTRGSISPYNIAGLIFEVSEEVATQIAKNWRRRQPHSHLRSPPRGTPTSIRYLIFPETRVIGLHFCRCTYGWVYNFIQICAVSWLGSKRRIFCTREYQSAFWPFDDFGFWYQSKARMRLLISPSLWLWSYLAPFAYFPIPLSFGVLALHVPFGILRWS